MACALGDAVAIIADRSSFARRITLLAIDERPSGYDPVAAAAFSRFRAHLGLTQEQVALRLMLPVPVLEALESGNLKQLPPVHTLRTAIRGYGRLANFDADSLIARLEAQTCDRPPLPHTRMLQDAANRREDPSLPGRSVKKAAPYNGKRRRPRSRVLAWAIVAAVPVGLSAAMVFSDSTSFTLDRATEHLVAAGWLAAGSDAVGLGSTGNGLRWIEVEDPQSRKTDRLPARQPLASAR